MKPAQSPEPNRLRIVDLTERCGNCAALEATIEQLRVDIDRLTKALQRESHVMDPREPHRRKV